MVLLTLCFSQALTSDKHLMSSYDMMKKSASQSIDNDNVDGQYNIQHWVLKLTEPLEMTAEMKNFHADFHEIRGARSQKLFPHSIKSRSFTSGFFFFIYVFLIHRWTFFFSQSPHTWCLTILQLQNWF